MNSDIDVLQVSLIVQRQTAELLKRHRRRVAENTVLPSSTLEQREVALRRYTDEELFARAKRARPTTVDRMETRAAAVYSEAKTAGVSVWSLVEDRSGNYNSWYTFKAGVQRYLEDAVVLEKRKLEFWERDRKATGSSPESDGVGARLVKNLDALALAIQQVPSIAPERFKGDGKVKRYAKRSKSASIRKVDEDWRERAVDAMAGNLRLSFLLQCVTGCRPQELANGVQVRLCRDGTMVTRVKGAKCDDFVGQPSRCLRLPTSDGVTLMLALMLEVGRTLDSRKCNLGQVNTYATRVARVCARVFPDRKGGKKLSPYSVRHQFKADLVAAGWAKPEIAMAMGHSTTRSGTAYGYGGRGGGGGVKPIAIKAQRPIKLRGEYPKARSGAAVSQTVQSGQRRRSKPKF